nr:hypothetical protein [Tanacetum cinerariifolium]
FDVQRLMTLLSGFARQYPRIRLDTVNGLSVDLHARLEAKEIDLALVKRDLPSRQAQRDEPALASWPEQVNWVAGREVRIIEDPMARGVCQSEPGGHSGGGVGRIGDQSAARVGDAGGPSSVERGGGVRVGACK